MARYLKTKIQTLLDESDNAPNTAVKGAKLEQLVRYLFETIPHISFYKSNVLDGPRAHELDVIFLNDQRKSDLHFLDFTIITECKNTALPTSSAQVGWFVRKLQDRAVNVGILISLNGITGEADGVSSAHSEILGALNRDGIKILVIKRDDILALKTTKDLIELIQKKILRLTLERTIE